ncbi:MAG: Crp/Fnr family transcriptional regulator [Bacteroidota bacterium]
MKEQLRQYIQKTVTITEEELAIVMSYFHVLKVEKNELLVVQGQVSYRIHFVCKGCLRFFFTNEDGQEATRYIAFENHFATALCSFISGSPSAEYLQALEPSDVLYINQNDFNYLLSIMPVWEKFYRHYLEKAYVNNTNKLMTLLTLNATERYKQLLAQNPFIVNRLPNKVVASYLNISQETLSRLKSKV